MQKKPSGLGRGLGDLLEDNAPEITKSTTLEFSPLKATTP